MLCVGELLYEKSNMSQSFQVKNILVLTAPKITTLFMPWLSVYFANDRKINLSRAEETNFIGMQMHMLYSYSVIRFYLCLYLLFPKIQFKYKDRLYR